MPDEDNECDRAFVDKDLLRCNEFNPIESELLQCKPCGEKPYVCKVCDKTFAQQCKLRNHERIHTDERRFVCTVCGKQFTRLYHLQDHEKVHTGEKPYKCKVCNKEFNRKRVLKVHERLHTGEKPYLCYICGKAFSERNTFNRHARIHAVEIPKVCKDLTEQDFEDNAHLVVSPEDKLDNHNAQERGFEARELLVHQESISSGNKEHQCKISDRISQSQYSREVHKHCHRSEKSFICKVCDKAFAKHCDLKNHEGIHNGERPYACTECNKHFRRLYHLQDHAKIHTGVKPYKCTFCCKAFRRKSELKVHERIHTGVKPYVCNICGKAFNQKNTYNLHAKIHVGKAPEVCKDVIGKCFEENSICALASLNMLDSYNACKNDFQDKDLLVNGENIPCRNDPNKCKPSGRISQSKYSLKVHKRCYSGEKSYTCQVCDKTFAQQCNLKTHERTHTRERPFVCAVCGKQFTRLYHLQDHEKIHTGEKPYKCKVCSKAFNRKRVLDVHERLHTGVRPYLCNTCGKAFNEKRTYNHHAKIHAGESPDVCIDFVEKPFDEESNLVLPSGNKLHNYISCDEGFKDGVGLETIPTGGEMHQSKINGGIPQSKDCLKVNEQYHIGEKGYVCNVCNKVFARKRNLKTHERIHAGERPYACAVCGQNFRRLYHLQDHTRIHTGLKPYNCKACSKAFKRNSDLKVHERVHTGEKPYKCNVCCKEFKDKGAFKRHEGIHTGKISCTNKLHSNKTSKLCHDAGEKPYSSFKRNKVFTSRRRLKVSRRNYNENRSCPLKDVACTFVQVLNHQQPSEEIFLKKEKNMSVSVLPFGCGFCNEMFVLETDFLNHCSTHNTITYCLIG